MSFSVKLEFYRNMLMKLFKYQKNYSFRKKKKVIPLETELKGEKRMVFDTLTTSILQRKKPNFRNGWIKLLL
jgi:hypothetical protein